MRVREIAETITIINQKLYFLRNNGVDVSPEEKILDNIMLKYCMSDVSTVREEYQSDLDRLNASFVKYQDLFDIKEKNETVESLNNEEISIRKSIELIYLLDSLFQNNFSTCQALIEKSIKVLYKQMKNEFIGKLDSKIFNTILEFPYLIKYFEEIIKLELEEIKESSFINNPEMIGILEKEEQRCRDSKTLFDKNLIIILISCTNKEKLIHSSVEANKPNIDKLDHTNKEMKKFIVYKYLDKIKEICKKHNKLKRSLKLRLTAFGLTSILITSSFSNIPNIAKKINYKNLYNTTREKYRLESVIYNEEKESQYEERLNKEGTEITLTITSELRKINHNHYHQVETVYDITDVELEKETPYYYIHLDTSLEGVKELSSKTLCYSTSDHNKEEVRELTIIKQDFNDKKEIFDEKNYVNKLIGLYIIMTLLTACQFLPPNLGYKLYKNLKQLKEERRNYNNLINYIDEIIDRIMFGINQKEEIKKQYKFLLQSGIIEKPIEELEQLVESINRLSYNIISETEKINELKLKSKIK